MKRVILTTLLLLPLGTTYPQSITVIGGNESARECFNNTLFSETGEFLSRSAINPCDYALENVSLSRQDRAATFTNRGILLYRFEEYDRAFADFENALDIDEELPEIYVNRGNAYFMLNEFDAALRDYNQALALNITQDYAVHLNLAMTYEKMETFQQALMHYERALDLRPEWELAQQRLQRLEARLAPESQ